MAENFQHICSETPENSRTSQRGLSFSEPEDPVIEFPDCQPIPLERSPSVWFSSRHSKYNCVTIATLLVVVAVVGIVGMTLLSIARNRKAQDQAQSPTPQLKDKTRVVVVPSVASGNVTNGSVTFSHTVNITTKKKSTTTKSPPQALITTKMNETYVIMIQGASTVITSSSSSRLNINTAIKPSPTLSVVNATDTEKLVTTLSAPSTKATEGLKSFTATVNSVPAISGTIMGTRTAEKITTVKTTLKSATLSSSTSSLFSSLCPLTKLSSSKSRDSTTSMVMSTRRTTVAIVTRKQGSTPFGIRSTGVVMSYVTATVTKRSVTPRVTTTIFPSTANVSVSTTQRLQTTDHRHTTATTEASHTTSINVNSSSAAIRPSATVGPTSTATKSPPHIPVKCKATKPGVIAAAVLVPMVAIALGIVGYVLYRRFKRNKYGVLSHPLDSLSEQGSATADSHS